MISLKHPYIKVNIDGRTLYGGNQDMMADKNMHAVGCGIISSVDTLLYLHLHHHGCKSPLFHGICSESIDFSRHEVLSEYMRKKFLPIIPHFGINGIELVVGINAYLRKYRIPLKAKLGSGKIPLFDAIDEMLSRDMPVILSVGPNFPAYWGKKLLPFYSKNHNDAMIHACSAKAHYVTVTGSDDKWLQISSWGRMYYINKQEYIDYMKQNSIPLFNTIVYFSEVSR